MNGGWPMVGSMKEGSTSTGSDILDVLFSFAILMVSIDTTKGKSLMATCNRRTECSGIEKAIVSMIMMNNNRMGLGKSFKGKFGSNSGVSIQFCHEVDIGEVQKMVNEDGCSNITLKCGASPMGRNKTWCRTN